MPGSALHDLSNNRLAGITELRMRVVQASLCDARGCGHVIHGSGLRSDRSHQSSDGGVQLTFQ
ncbi:hypothetical protein D3C84_1240840 [compost metagenome]